MGNRLSLRVKSVDSTIQGPHGSIPVRWYAPPDNVSPRRCATIVWIHGGGFFKGGLDQPESHDVARTLAAAGFRVVTVAYRLATLSKPRRSGSGSVWSPAVHFPVPVDDVVAVVREVQREAVGKVILGGASAGACLSAGAVLRLADAGADGLAGVFFAYGFFHAALPKRSRQLRSRLRGPRRFVHTPMLLNLTNLHYAGTRTALSNAHAFPGGHPLGGFPPTLMVDADRDSMRSSAAQFAEELSATGTAVDYHVLPETLHAFLNRPQEPAFTQGLRLIIDWAGQIDTEKHYTFVDS
ncbi:alpha/beta hydrolase [Cryobacterium serini]|uniref:Alpha/beta hydrolase n=1 Tax=Cryobacterium serini TaxID=1259201 RepID=A0A4R9BQW1_9MICO|nr:alpha/beta hydrolase [Cryobacterium serini]TFD88982.1 alpha/beta hydrolase [Cryobacterium serini]